MMASTLNPQLQTTLMRKLSHSSSHKKNFLQKGFTLVELMVVIVIVGVLSAVALPNFLNQTSRAKGTEAKSQISAILKNAAAEFQQGGIGSVDVTSNSCELLGGPKNGVQLFNYSCTKDATTETVTVTATGNSKDSAIENNIVEMKITMPSGTVELVKANTMKMFGGTKADV